MLAEQNPIIEDAVVTMYEMSAEDAIREQCRAREDYYRTINTYEAHIRKRDQKLEQQAEEINQLTNEIERLKALLEKHQGQE